MLILPATTLAHAAARLPVAGIIIADFDPPDQPWLPGHRGIDIAAPVGTPVVATAPGTVVWVGEIGGVTSVSIELADSRRHTYQPLDPSVTLGEQVTAGQRIGVLGSQLVDNGHCPSSCLHWGLKLGDDYFDPRFATQVRLLPANARPTDSAMQSSPSAVARSSIFPTNGRVTSTFGMRVHPVTGSYALHDGVDLASECGTPVRVPWAGSVTAVYRNIAWGNRVVVNHGMVNGRRLSSSYSHLATLPGLKIGASVAAGAIIGQVGTTGYSTGCHLHWSTSVNDAPIDPLTLS